jgi:lysozyme
VPNEPTRIPGGKLTLASIVGIGVAIALGTAIPKEESGRTVEATIAQTGELQVRHISGKQYLRAYLDIVGVATACDGIAYVPRNAVYTEAQCTAMLERELIEHATAVMACTPGLALSSNPAIERQREGPRFAAVSLGYNIGTGRFCRSTARARFNAGRYPEGCEALKLWNRAGGVVVRGLVNRRAREARVCHNGLGAL